MNLKNLNEGFDKRYKLTEESEEAVSIGNSASVKELKKSLQSANDRLQAKYSSNIKEYEVAFQDAIEKQFPGKSWWEVTDCNIFWSLFNEHNPQKTITDILSKLKIDTENESVAKTKNPLDGLRSNIIEFPNGEYVYIGYENGKLFAGSATNTGIIHEFEIDYDDSVSVDENIGELYDTIVENNPSYLDDADDLGESVGSKVGNKALNEGPGAGYTISCTTTANDVKSIKFTNVNLHGDYGAIIDAECDIPSITTDIVAESYGYSTSQSFKNEKIASQIYAFSVECNIEDIVDEDVDMENMSADQVLKLLNSNVDKLTDNIMDVLSGIDTSEVYGGGWSHSTYDGTVTSSDFDSSYDNSLFVLSSVGIILTDKKAIEYIDKAVSGDNQSEVFFAVFDGAWEEGFATEEEAIAYAKENDCNKVIRTYDIEDYNGDVDYDDYSETVWTNGVDEALASSHISEIQVEEKLEEASVDKRFKIGTHDIQTVKVRNPYNYTIQELRINNRDKTFERGNFSMGRADKELKNRQQYEDIVDELIAKGYKEVKGDAVSLRNKTRKGVPTRKESGMNERNLTRSERHNKNLNQIFDNKKSLDSKYAKFLTSKGYSKEQIAKLTADDKLGAEIASKFVKNGEQPSVLLGKILNGELTESKRGFVKKQGDCSIHDAGDVFVVTNKHGLNIGQSRTMSGAESIADEYNSKNTNKKVNESVEKAKSFLQSRLDANGRIKPLKNSEKLPRGVKFKNGTGTSGEITVDGTDYAFAVVKGKLRVMPSSQAGSNWSETIYKESSNRHSVKKALKESEGYSIVDDVNAFKAEYPKGWVDNGKELIVVDTTTNRHRLEQFNLLDCAKLHSDNMFKRDELIIDYSVPYTTWTVHQIKGVTENKKINESVDSAEKKQALANYLGVDVGTLSDGYGDYVFETEDGEEYIVADEDEAHDLARQDIESIYDDLGFKSFTPNFQDWIINNALDTDWFDEAMRESYELYANDIREESSNTYDNRLIEEMYDAGVLTDDDFETAEDGEIDYTTLSDDNVVDDKFDEFIDYLCNNYSDSVEWYKSEFGTSELSDAIKLNPSVIDMDSVVEEAIGLDGVAHFIASYDGDELELENGLFAYRTN